MYTLTEKEDVFNKAWSMKDVYYCTKLSSKHGNRKLFALQIVSHRDLKPKNRFGTFLHYHKKAEELFFVVQGSMQVQIENDFLSLHSGDFVRVPQNTAHSILTTSNPTIIFCLFAIVEDFQDKLYGMEKMFKLFSMATKKYGLTDHVGEYFNKIRERNADLDNIMIDKSNNSSSLKVVSKQKLLPQNNTIWEPRVIRKPTFSYCKNIIIDQDGIRVQQKLGYQETTHLTASSYWIEIKNNILFPISFAEVNTWMYVCGGSIQIRKKGGTASILKQGDIVFIPQGTSYQWLSLEDQTQCFCIYTPAWDILKVFTIN
ncbi:MAG: cupin domain-containing protein [Phycisphaerales bacterium]|nr:cupin domain-containing protein [Phycisphaerales bacterium]